MSLSQTGLRIRFMLLVLPFLAGMFPFQAVAHGEVHALIAALTKRIAAAPDSTSLYLQRGILYEGHGEFDHALADYQTVKLKAPELKVADLRIASLLTDQGHFNSALVFVNAFLAQEPNNVPALQVRSMVYTGLGQDAQALQDRITALEHADPRGPEFYLDVARGVLKADPAADSTAIAWLDRGLSESGFLISLADYAVSLEVGAGQYNKALARVEDIILRIPNNVQWMVARAEILALSGETLKSEQAYGAALLKIEALPAERRNTENIQNMERTVRSILRLSEPR